jgi:hypothetical protein
MATIHWPPIDVDRADILFKRTIGDPKRKDEHDCFHLGAQSCRPTVAENACTQDWLVE